MARKKDLELRIKAQQVMLEVYKKENEHFRNILNGFTRVLQESQEEKPFVIKDIPSAPVMRRQNG